MAWRRSYRGFPNERTNHLSTDATTLAGFPAAMEFGGMLEVTTLPAPITVLSPISTPLRIRHRVPTKTSLPIEIGFVRGEAAESKGTGWKSVSAIMQSPPIKVRSPIRIDVAHEITELLIPT